MTECHPAGIGAPQLPSLINKPPLLGTRPSRWVTHQLQSVTRHPLWTTPTAPLPKNCWEHFNDGEPWCRSGKAWQRLVRPSDGSHLADEHVLQRAGILQVGRFLKIGGKFCGNWRKFPVPGTRKCAHIGSRTLQTTMPGNTLALCFWWLSIADISGCRKNVTHFFVHTFPDPCLFNQKGRPDGLCMPFCSSPPP